MLKRHLAPRTLEKLLRNALCPESKDGAEVSLGEYLKRLRSREKEGKGHEE